MAVVQDYRALLSNQSWTGGPAGDAAILTYSFTTGPNPADLTANPSVASSFHPLNDSEKATVRAALAQWSAVSGVTFHEVTSTPGDLTFGFYDLTALNGSSGEAGEGYYPETGAYMDGSGVPQVYGGAFDTTGGDVLFDDSYQTNPTYFSDFAHVAIHEIGHALGLKHPFDTNSTGPSYTLDPALDNGSETVMAYAGIRSATLEPLDIAAVQYLYGTPTTALHPFSETWNQASESLTLVGTATTANVMFGSGGNDVFYSMGAHDALSGGQGNDLFYAAGKPIGINGGTGTDTAVTGLAYTGASQVAGTGTGFRSIYLPSYADFQIFTNVATLDFTNGAYDTASSTFTSFDSVASPGMVNLDSYSWTVNGGGDWGDAANWLDQSYPMTLLPPGAANGVALNGATVAAAPNIITGAGKAAAVSLGAGYEALSGVFGFSLMGIGGAGNAGLKVASGRTTVAGQASVAQTAAQAAARTAALTVAAGAALQVGSLVLSGSGALAYATGGVGGAAVSVAGSLEVGAAGSAASGTFTVDVGNVLSGSGAIAAAVVDRGTVLASGGQLALTQGVSGGGLLLIGSSGTLVLTGGVSQGVGFMGAGGVLDLVRPAAVAQAGLLAGFAAGNTIEVIAPVTATTATYRATATGLGTLTLSAGAATVASFQLAGSYGGANFQVATHAGGVADVTIAPYDQAFDPAYYLAHNPDVAAAGVDPYQHYLLYGWKEGRNPDPFFDTNYYLAHNADVRAAGVNPLAHFEAFGWKEGRDPSLVFSDQQYLAAYPDVKAAGVDPLLHYLVAGQAEGRTAFLSGGAAAADPLVSAGYLDPQLGATLVPVGVGAAQQAASAYHGGGWLSGENPDAWFDTAYYLAHNPDVAAAHVDPLLHYENFGWLEGRNPSAAFSTNKYLAAYADVRAAHVDPLLHYVLNGQAEGRTAFTV